MGPPARCRAGDRRGAGLEEATGAFVVSVRLRRRDRHRCGICRRRSRGYDGGDGRRRWRAPDLGLTRAYLEADAPRVRCPEHGVVVAAVPWAATKIRLLTRIAFGFHSARALIALAMLSLGGLCPPLPSP